ncbi:DUF1445 domain-containing protein [Helicobacter sp. 13S00401-1]|uniref:putative hydro-lyase n=1 Tax=Helicobacter sp. 13S00401-1 TaxID=1905758 RepID=UPI000BA5FD6D|nr:putative hydro-lyase [Helicobacter sp. 13S00401-1]PAF50372.1 DUF1445 domain-containing protein [Helicobacter sp. 13S00401-1]
MASANQTKANEARLRYRAGSVEPTAGVALGYTQANLVVLPKEWAYDFLVFAQRNPKPCPILDVSDVGSFKTFLAPSSDLRTDLPLYRIWRDGKLSEELRDARKAWDERDDLVSFLIGCSFTFESALLDAGISLRHIDQNLNVSMYLTNQSCRPAGRLSGNLVVSMRPIKASLVQKARDITALYPSVHGAPVHIGSPSELGIASLSKPDFGDAVEIKNDEVPMFWACGVTPQAIVMASKIPFAITHAPGHMFITDVLESNYKV